MIMEAVRKLREINWEVDDDSTDLTFKKVIVAPLVLTDDDIAGFQSYTIRTLDKKLTTVSDIEQYNQKFLDVMCSS